jgi:hypothetical protein
MKYARQLIVSTCAGAKQAVVFIEANTDAGGSGF